MISLREGIKKIYSLPPPAAEVLISAFNHIELPAKSLIIKSGQISDTLYFVSKGCLSAYYHTNSQRVTLWLGHEGDFVTCFKSWLTQTPGHETIELMEDGEFYTIRYNSLLQLVNENLQINNFYRRMIEEGYLYWENRATMLLFSSARQRLDNLLKREPRAMQRWPLGHIASYLGITQETLSRLRAQR